MEKYLEQFKKDREIYLKIKARPNASKTKFIDVLDTGDEKVLKISVAAIPEKGKANETLILFLAHKFKVHKKNVYILSGASSKYKLIKIISD